jgi:predicted Zn-dependent peptidase
MNTIETHRFPNGLLLVLEKLPKSRSCGIAVGFPAGGRNEKAEVSGISHYLEHMIFKGTKTVRNISKAFERLGANVNAITDVDSTVYLAECPQESGIETLKLWLQFLAEASIDREEFERERGVIASEYFISEDNPDILVEKNATLSLFNGHPLASTVIGSEETIKAISHEDMTTYFCSMYHPVNSVIWVSGDLPLGKLIDCIEKQQHWTTASGAPALSYERFCPRSVPAAEIKRQIKLAQVGLAFSSPTDSAGERASFQIFSSMLSAARSSVLRRKLILEGKYTDKLRTAISSYKEAGIFLTSFAIEPGKTPEVLDTLTNAIGNLKSAEQFKEDFERAKSHAVGSFTATVDMRMMWRTLAGALETLRRGYCSWDEWISSLESLTFDQFTKNLQEIIQPKRIALVLAGSIKEETAKDIQSKLTRNSARL